MRSPKEWRQEIRRRRRRLQAARLGGAPAWWVDLLALVLREGEHEAAQRAK